MNYEQTVTELKEYFTENQETEGKMLKVSISELEKFNPELSDYFKQEPKEAKKAAKEAIQQENQEETITIIKFTEIPDEDHIEPKDIGAKDISNLAAVRGLITNIEDAKVERESALFKCKECGDLSKKDQRDQQGLRSPYKCDGCGGRKFDLFSEEYFDVQNFTISADNKKLECRIESETLEADDYLDREVIAYGIPEAKGKDPGAKGRAPEAKGREVKLKVESIEGSDSSSHIENTKPISDLIGNNSAGNSETVLNSLTPLDFEKLIARIFKAEGWETELSNPAEDQEIDIIIRKRLPLPRKFLIETKYYEESKVTSEDIINYNSLKEKEPNTDQAILITSSTCTDKAKELANSLGIKTLDRDYVIRMINKIEQ